MNNKIKALITVPPTSSYCDFCGRWEVTEDYASSTACGSWFRIGFSGETALLCFDTSECVEAFPHIYISVDNGAMIECPVSEAIRIRATHDGVHEACVTIKSSLETQERWFSPTAKVSFMGLADADGAPLVPDTRKTIEFLGDSITEGSSVYPQLLCIDTERWTDALTWTNDAAAGYAYRTANLLNMRGVFAGYGCSGVTHSGGGNAGRASVAFSYLRDGIPYTGDADIVVINHGTNDRKAPFELFQKRYYELLDLIRSSRKNAKIFAVAPFPDTFVDKFEGMIAEYNKENGTDIIYINTYGWVPKEPLHPLKESHFDAAKKLADAIRKHI